MNIIAFEVLLVLLLIVANGVFAMSELAVVSSRKVRLQHLAGNGDESARAALELANNPDRFLSTVQIGITLIGILAGAFGGATIAEQIAASVEQIPALAPYGEAIGLAVVVIAITYLSLIIGELVPKRLALHNSERVALLVARPMRFLSWLATPFVSLLSFSSSTVFKLLRLKPSTDPPVTEEEIKVLIEQGTQAGVFDKTEQEFVGRVFRLGDRRVNVLMTPRREIFWLDINSSEQEIFQEITTSQFSRFPVSQNEIDNVVGIIKAKEYLAGKLINPKSTLKDYLKEPLFVPETDTAFHVLEQFKSKTTHLALIIDEFGAIQGMVTSNDFLEAITGEAAHFNPANAPIVERADGSWLVDASLPIDEFVEFFAIKLAGDEKGDYQTLAGLILAQTGHIPAVAEVIEFNNLRFEIMDLDERRIDKVLVSYIESEENAE
jgi:putative hemolysin